MGHEIVPTRDGSEAPLAGDRPFESLDVVGLESVGVKFDLIGGNHRMRHFLRPDQGHKQVTLLSPTPASVKPVLEKMKEPSVLGLRGCQLLLRSEFPFRRFKTLTSLEISHCSFLTTLPEKEISEMNQLQSLNLSHLPIHQLPHDFFSNLTDLRTLVLRGCCNLQSLPEFPKLAQLECLHLADLLIDALPEGIFAEITDLRWLILRGCSKLRSIPSTHCLTKLEVLDLSHCTILQELNGHYLSHECLQMLDLSYTALRRITLMNTTHLTHLFVREIKVKLYHPPQSLCNLKVVDRSGAQNLEDVDMLKENLDLTNLDLSRTKIESIDSLSGLSDLRNLILRECSRLVRLPGMKMLTNLEVLDISGCKMLSDLPEDLDNLRKLKELSLCGCSRLKELREGVFDHMSCLEKLDLSKTSIKHLPSFANLTNLQTLNLSQTLVEKEPDLSNLKNLKEVVLANRQELKVVPDVVSVHSGGVKNFEEKVVVSNSDEFHLVSTFISDSGFDRFKLEFKKLDYLISDIQKFITSTNYDATSPNLNATTTSNVANTIARSDKMTQTFKMNFGRIRSDLRYILEHIDLLETSVNCRTIEELLLELVSIAACPSYREFLLVSTNLNLLLQTVVKLKLLVPRPSLNQVDVEYKKKRKKKLQFMNKSDDEDANDLGLSEMHDKDSASYESLTDIQRKCLLYFAVFPSGEFSAMIKVATLVDLWYGEGLIEYDLFATSASAQPSFHSPNLLDPIKSADHLLYEEGSEDLDLSAALTYPQSISIQSLDQVDPVKSADRLLYEDEEGLGDFDLSVLLESAEQVLYEDEEEEEELDDIDLSALLDKPRPISIQRVDQLDPIASSNGMQMDNPKTIKEIGHQILKVLEEKKFISISGAMCYMECDQHSFIKAQAKVECFFDFNINGKLTSNIVASKRACLLKSQDNWPPSSQLWLSYADSFEKLESLKNIHTLLYVNEPVLDIRPEWISSMPKLSVLHLAPLGCENEEHIDVVDLKFLDELMNMKQLRLLSLVTCSALVKLPDSICKLANLRILNLGYCTNLEELPAEIGSLENLTCLDLTQCHLLSKLPKGLRLLSKLEVLKGFVIQYEVSGRQHRKACTLRELLKLEKLRKLNLVVNEAKFPNSQDLQVFKEMKNLCSLMITWRKNYYKEREAQDSTGKEASRQSLWKRLKCWEQQSCQDDTEEEQLGSNLEKLVLCCFPLEIVPNWLHPSEFPKLERLYIVGGNLKTLLQGMDQATWDVKILHLKYLYSLDMVWSVLKGIFPNMTSFQKTECPHIRNFNGKTDVWTIEKDEGSDSDSQETLSYNSLKFYDEPDILAVMK